MSFLLSPIGRALLGLVFVAGLLAAAWFDGYTSGLKDGRAAILTRSVEVLRERNRVDEQARNMDSPELCRALGGKWVLEDNDCQ